MGAICCKKAQQNEAVVPAVSVGVGAGDVPVETAGSLIEPAVVVAPIAAVKVAEKKEEHQVQPEGVTGITVDSPTSSQLRTKTPLQTSPSRPPRTFASPNSSKKKNNQLANKVESKQSAGVTSKKSKPAPPPKRQNIFQRILRPNKKKVVSKPPSRAPSLDSKDGIEFGPNWPGTGEGPLPNVGWTYQNEGYSIGRSEIYVNQTSFRAMYVPKKKKKLGSPSQSNKSSTKNSKTNTTATAGPSAVKHPSRTTSGHRSKPVTPVPSQTTQQTLPRGNAKVSKLHKFLGVFKKK